MSTVQKGPGLVYILKGKLALKVFKNMYMLLLHKATKDPLPL